MSPNDTKAIDLDGDDVAEQPEPESKRPSDEILRQELSEALKAFDRSKSRLFFSGLSAGLELGFSLMLMAIMQSLVQNELPPAITALLVANMYSFGFILVILGRSELFTEQTSLAVLPVLHGRATVKSLGRLWGIVYLANLLGAALVSALIVLVGPALGVIDPNVLVKIADRAVEHPALVIVFSGVLAGWLMGLLSWLVAAGRDTISQIVIVWMVTAVIGLGHFHHCILGSIEVLAGVYTGEGPSIVDFGHFLLWATLGNALGGPIFLAILKYTHARPAPEDRQS